jgi:hypothetical protein
MSSEVYLEVGARRTFAVSLDWPGWCRTGKGEEAAIKALVEAAPRYAKSLGKAAEGFSPPSDGASLKVVERVSGDATTDFGAPSKQVSSDDRPLRPAELERLAAIHRACWSAFDRAVKKHATATLRKGPRGGGREMDAIVRHVLEADAGYLSGLGGKHPKAEDRDVTAEMRRLRREIAETLAARVRGDALPPRRKKVWAPRYFIRRSAWHAIDHAWEIQDRAI